MSAPSDPFTLVTINSAPERAKRLIGRVAELLSDRQTIIPIDICEDISASMWTDEEAKQIYAIARSINPTIKLHAIPNGLQVERGPDAIVEHLCEKVPPLLDSWMHRYNLK
ncbi:uncharacterized protein N7484_004751 [Penicillium longicatenatum]|uniref:uncharacterized protein n=1 Tax=Penicillium longicatenatum TaxID=1561947 RepID=UPI00254956BF|nr:uncharacterized protein N7484_004751 [Penicillium longicatenatum]KAJ5651028.1 hypothetical protein N7484_004751 [Penicillium longicatenatum]